MMSKRDLDHLPSQVHVFRHHSLYTLYPIMLGCDRVFRILSSSFSLCPNWDRVSLLFTLTAQEDLNLFPAGDLSYRKTLTPVPYPSLVRKGMAGRWTEGELQLGVVSSKREMCLLLTVVKGALMMIIFVASIL